MICPDCQGETDQQDINGNPLICNSCKEAELGREVLANTVGLISQLCAGGDQSDQPCQTKRRFFFL